MMHSQNAGQIRKSPAASNAARLDEVLQVAWIRVGAIGDMLVALACLEETLTKFPNSKVWVFGPKLWLQVIDPRLWPRINGIVVIDKNSGEMHTPDGAVWRASGVRQKLRAFFSLCQASVNLRVESYRFAWGPFFAGVKYRFGTCPWPLKFLYSHWSPWLGKDPIIHERDRMLEILEAPPTKTFPLGQTQCNRDRLKEKQTGEYGKKADKYVVFQPQQNPNSLAFKWRDKALPQIALADEVSLQTEYGLSAKRYWLVNPTSSRWEKAWPKDKFRELCARLKALSDQKNRELIVIGSLQETEWLQYVADNHLKIVQPKSIRDLANIVCQAELLITNTSSVQYIAACAKTPTLTLMGRTFPARWGPLGAKDMFLAGRVPLDFKGNIFEEDYAGYDSLSVDFVFDHFQKWHFN